MKDQQIERAQNMDEVINVMKKKQENLSKEKKQITGPAADSKNERAVNKGAAKAVN